MKIKRFNQVNESYSSKERQKLYLELFSEIIDFIKENVNSFQTKEHSYTAELKILNMMN